MKHPFISTILGMAAAVVLTLAATSCTARDDSHLVVYTYDSFAGEWGPGPVIEPFFEKSTGIQLDIVAAGDAGQVLARLIDESGDPAADVVVGIDNLLLPKALAADVLVPYRPATAATVPAALVMDPEWHLTPYDWGCFAIIWDSERLAAPPASLEDLTKPEYARMLILMDPRTSTPGLGFLAWTAAVYGDGLSAYWKRLSPSILAMTPGWDAGYGLFTTGEAPLVLSYTTSPAYHAEYETAGRYRALIFAEGHPLQVEGAGIVKGAKHPEAARAFMDFVLGQEFQSTLPLTNWMYPISDSIALPGSFSYAPKPDSYIPIRVESLTEAVRTALNALGKP